MNYNNHFMKRKTISLYKFFFFKLMLAQCVKCNEPVFVHCPVCYLYAGRGLESIALKCQ